ncbi:MAG: hypothetical protein ACYDCL_18705 [Myxococcales bacterium]
MILDYTFLLMRQAGQLGDERFVVWAGSAVDGKATVTSLVIPSTKVTALHGEVPAEVAAHLLEALERRDLVPLAQLHTHPREPLMSHIDEERPLVSLKGFLSIIVPDFAFVPLQAVEKWGVYEYERPRCWRAWKPREAYDRIIIDDSVLRVD